MTFFQNVSYVELAIIVAVVAVTLVSLRILCHLLNTVGRGFDDEPALIDHWDFSFYE